MPTKRHTNAIDIHIGQKLKRRRTALGITQEDLGAILNVSFQQVQKYEGGVNRVSSSALYELARHLKTTVNYFFDGLMDGISFDDHVLHLSNANTNLMLREDQSSYNEPDAEAEPEVSQQEIAELASNYSKIQNPLLRQSILKLVKDLSGQIAPKD